MPVNIKIDRNKGLFCLVFVDSHQSQVTKMELCAHASENKDKFNSQ